MKKIYWLKTSWPDGRLRFYPSGTPLPPDAWESIDVTDEEWQKFKDGEERLRRELQYAFSHPDPKYFPPAGFECDGKFGFEGFKP